MPSMSFHCGETFAYVIYVSSPVQQNLRTGNVSDRKILDCHVKTEILCLINRTNVLHCQYLCLFLFYQISPTYLGK